MPHSRSDGRPSFPLNLLADFAGGGLTAATGVLLALLEQHKSGIGQVVETDMVRMTLDRLPVHTATAGLRRPLHIILSSHPSSPPQPVLLQSHGIESARRRRTLLRRLPLQGRAMVHRRGTRAAVLCQLFGNFYRFTADLVQRACIKPWAILEAETRDPAG